MTGPTRSLRGRLVLGAFAVGLTFAVLFGLTAYWRIHRVENRAVSAALNNRLDLARNEIAIDGTLRSDLANPKTDLVQVIRADGTVHASTAALRGVGPLADPAIVRRSATDVRGAVTLQVPDVDLATLAVPAEILHNGHLETGALVVAVDTEGFTTANSDLTGLLVGGLAAVLVVLVALSWVITGRTLRSVSKLTDDAEQAGGSDSATGLPVPVGDAELSRLVQALNRMLGRIHNSHTAELTFAADAGHRLRTPVATLRAEAELALDDPDPDSQTSALRQIISDADQLALIVDRMLARSRRRSHQSAAVTTVLTQASERWQRQAQLAHLKLVVSVATGVTAELYCEDLLDVVDPIVENAIRYCPTDGHIDITAAQAAHPTQKPGIIWLRMTVSNTGPPIPSHLAPHIFDAWVSSRDGSEAGGLGLWIARETAHDCGGDIALDQSVPGQTTFVVDLPMQTAAPRDEAQDSDSSPAEVPPPLARAAETVAPAASFSVKAENNPRAQK